MSIESLAELLRFQSELAVDRAKRDIEQQKATAEAFTPTPAQAAYIPTIFAPGSGIADASGVFPEFPSADVPLSEYLSGEPMPSIAENIAAGGIDRYLIAPLQALGVAGDALYAVPGVGPVLGATLGSGLKGIGALGIAARAASKTPKLNKNITKSEFVELSRKGKIFQARNQQESLDALLKGDSPAQDFSFFDEFDDFAIDYETGDFTKRLQDAGFYVIDDNMGRVVAGKTKTDAENLLKAKNPFELGRSYGFSDEDIAKFYVTRRGDTDQGIDLAYEEFLTDLPTESKGIIGLDETKNLIKADIDEFAKDDYGFVSPTLEALIREAPPNLKGPAINDWLAANTQKGVKPKELEVLGIDEFIEANPEATLSEVVAGVAPNKVQISKTVRYQRQERPTIDFDVTTPEFDPLDPTLKNYQHILDDLPENLKDDNYKTAEFYSHFLDDDPKIFFDPSEVTNEALQAKKIEFDDYLKKENFSYDGALEQFARQQYYDYDPYELIKVYSVGDTPAYIPDKTFAFGNVDVGYQLFIGGKRVTDPDNIAYSRAEAQIQLQNKLEEGGDPLRRVDEDPFDYDVISTADPDPDSAKYKSYIDGTLPGGSNYREVVFEYENAPEPHNVTTHFDDNQALAHALIRDRKLEDGAATLHVDELQSDLHTDGSKYGYRPTFKEKNLILDKAQEILEGSGHSINKPPPHLVDQPIGSHIYVSKGNKYFGDFGIANIEYLAKRLRKGEVTGLSDLANALVESLGAQKIYELEKVLKPLSKSRAVPNYPFKDDWYVMSLKQLIKDAIDEGKDAISVSTSAPIKARYTDQYNKFYESLYDQKIPSAMKKLANKYGGKFEKGGRLEIEDTLGRDFLPDMQKDIDSMPEPYSSAKAIDVAEEQLELLNVNIIRITPEMRAKIAEEGLPSFAYGGSVNRQKTLTMPQKTLTMPEDVNIFADAQFTQPETLTEKIVSGMTDLAFGRITKDDFFRDNVVRNVLTQLKVPSVIQDNLLRSKEAQNFALDTLQQAIGSPVDVTALGDDRFALDYSQRLGPGILSLASEFGKGEDTGRVSYDSKDFFVAPSTTARFAASLDKDRGKAFTTGVTYRPDPKTFVEGRAIFGEGRSPEYRIDFGRRF